MHCTTVGSTVGQHNSDVVIQIQAQERQVQTQIQIQILSDCLKTMRLTLLWEGLTKAVIQIQAQEMQIQRQILNEQQDPQ